MIEIQHCVKGAFSVIGKEGSTRDGTDFMNMLWNDANTHFHEVSSLAKKDENGNFLGVWGLMSDFSKLYRPWENDFSQGLYLAGVEVEDDAIVAMNWTKWTVPSFEYLYAKVTEDYNKTFHFALDYMKEHNLSLVGAVFDFVCPLEKGQLYIFLPIRKM